MDYIRHPAVLYNFKCSVAKYPKVLEVQVTPRSDYCSPCGDSMTQTDGASPACGCAI